MFVSKENLYHFRCGDKTCDKWWTVGDPDTSKTDWWCPWCGTDQTKDITQPDYPKNNS